MSVANNNKIEFANTLRGFAALSVVISHYLGVFWLKRDVVAGFINAKTLSDKIGTSPIISFLNSATIFGWGEFGVGLFFLISGFVIPFSLLKLNRQEFILNRIFRIYPTYACGFSFTLIAIYLCGLYFGKSFVYTFTQVLMHYFPGVHDIFRANIDGVIWTLDIEIKFYLLCALSAAFFKRQSSKIFLIPLIIGVATLCIIPGVNYLTHVGGFLFICSAVFLFTMQYIVFMFIGVTFNYCFRKIIKIEEAILLIISLFFLFALISRYSLYTSSERGVWSYGFALLLFAFAFAYPRFFRGNVVVNYLADISYPLYVVHRVLGYVLMRVLLDVGCNTKLTIGMTIVFVVSLATLLHKFIELPSQEIGKYIVNRLQMNRHTIRRLEIETL